MKKCLLLLILSVMTVIASATTFRSAATGNWNVNSTWSPSGTPSNRDTVILNGLFVVTVPAGVSVVCGELTVTGINSVLTIAAGGTLTVTNNATMLVDDVTDISTINLLGTLTVGGTLSLTYGDALAAVSSNLLNVGNATSAGTLNVTGNIQLTANTTLSLLGVRSTIKLYQGTINASGNIAFSASGAGANVQSISVEDDGTYDGKTKVINLSKNITNPTSGLIALVDANNNAPYTFRYIGTTQQNFVTTNVTYKHVDIANTNAEVWFVNDVNNNSLYGNFKVKNGGVLNVKSFNMDDVQRYAGQIAVENGGTYRLENKTGIPARKIGGVYVCTAALNSVFDYYAPTAATSLDIWDEEFSYGIVRLSGPGIKLMNSQDLNNSAVIVNQVQLTEGTFSITRTKKFMLANNLDKTCYIGSGTTVIINGDFNTLDAFFSIDYNSLFSYIETGTQQIYSYKNKTGAIEPYGNLSMSRSGLTLTNRNVNANEIIRVRGKLNIGGNIKLNINQNAYVELMSDAQYTGYLSELPTSSSINYLGSPAGKFITKKYIGLTDANYRDVTSPVDAKTLATFQNAGMYMTGFTGSLYPSIPFVSAYQYDEANTGVMNDGFVGATNITNSLFTTNASSKITASAWRIYTGESTGQTYTLSDTGNVKTGTQTYALSFTHGTNNRTTDDGWNFLGNPYPSAISWTKVYNDAENAGSIAANGIKPTIYIWRPNDTGVPYDEEDSYGFYNAVTGISNFLTTTIPSYQGFWLKAYHATLNATTFDLKIKESHKIDVGASTFYKAGEEQGNANESLVKVTLQQGELNDNIWFHPYNGATVGVDKDFDIERFGEVYDGPNLNFSNNNESMNLWVNALPSKGKDVQFPVQVFVPETGEFTISLSNIAGFNAAYGCIRLVDQKTGMVYPISQDTILVFQGDGGSREERFIIYANKNLLSALTVADATCFDKQDGLLALDLSDYEDQSNFTLLKEGQLYNNYFGTITSINEQLGRGNYQLINNAGNIDCAISTYDFTINSAPEVIAAFEAPEEWREDSYVPLHNSSIGATSYKWEFSDFQATSNNKTPNYIFEEAGTFTISLISINEFGCESTEYTKSINILSTTGVQDISKSDIIVRNTENGILISTPSGDECTVDLYTLDGKMVYKSGKITGTEVISLERRNTVYLVVVTGSKGTFTTKTVH